MINPIVTIVLLPGMDGTGSMFGEFISFLGNDIKPMVLSYPENRPLGYLELEDFVRPFLPLNEPFVLLGESFSGPIAISIAASRPAGLIGVVLSCTYCRNPVPWCRPFRHIVHLLPITSKLTWLAAPILFGRFVSVALCRSLKQALDRVPPNTIRARMRAVLDIDFSGQLKDIQVPILYLQASEDFVVPPSASRRVMHLSGAIELVKLRAPHLLLQVLPSECAVIVEKFIKRVLRNRG